jgi:hypothetical protein
MKYSSELVYEMTRNHNAFLRKNLHQIFTADPFSATNATNAANWGFHSKRATSLQIATGKKAEKGQVTVLKRTNKKRITKKGKKNNSKAPGFVVTSKTVASKKVIGNKCSQLAARGVRLHQAVLRGAALNKQSK